MLEIKDLTVSVEDKKILDEETALIVKTIGILLKKGIGDYSGQLGMLQKE